MTQTLIQRRADLFPSQGILTIRKPSAHPMRRAMSAATIGLLVLSLLMVAAQPVRADSRSDQMARALLAAIAIGAVVHTIDKNKKKRRAAEAAQPPVLEPEPTHGPGSRHRVIPAACGIEIVGSRRAATVYPERCLRREGVRAHLPQQCSFKARIYGREDWVYGGDCLRDAGFRIEDGRGWDDRHNDDRRGRRHGDWRYDHNGY